MQDQASSMANITAGWTWAFCQLWLCWALAITIIHDKQPSTKHVCPSLRIVHGVGSDLRTYQKEVDLCSNIYR